MTRAVRASETVTARILTLVRRALSERGAVAAARAASTRSIAVGGRQARRGQLSRHDAEGEAVATRDQMKYEAFR